MLIRFLACLFIILSLDFSYCCGQDPTCEIILSLGQIETNYDYKVMIKFRNESVNIDTLEMRMEKDWDWYKGIEMSMFSSDLNNQILIGYVSSYCYPNSNYEDQLGIIIARKEKGKADVELMYTFSELIPSRTEVFIEKFETGERECEIFEYKSDYTKYPVGNYGYQQRLTRNSRKIYFK